MENLMILSKPNYAWFKGLREGGIIVTMTGTMEEIKSKEPQPILHSIKSTSKHHYPFLVIAVGIVLLGVATGYFLQSSSGGSLGLGTTVSDGKDGEAEKGKTYGSDDKETFPDEAEGVLEEGGLDGEGSHKLVRPGGESQTAYLTSSTLDLDEFVGKKIKVWGQTNEAQKAGWFMDVGRVEVIE